ncbi:MAG: septum formation initiator [Acidimicrobiales bacterium]|nr:septum formation initiator [Acidimicrobiales bacterium]
MRSRHGLDRRSRRALGRVDGGRGQRDGETARRRQARRPRRRLVFAMGVSVLLVGVLFVAVFPTRTYLAQRAATRKADARLAQLAAEKRTLDAQATRLETPAEIERLAREWFGMVRPGEEAYAVLPKPVPPIGLPDIWPFTGLDQRLTTR